MNHINYVWGFLILSVGITIGKLLDWGYFELSKEISIIEALTLFSTIGLAIYIAKTLEKEVQDNRVKRDLYISKYIEIETLLEIIGNSTEKKVQYQKLVNRIHLCGVKRNSIFEKLQKSNIVNKNDIDKTDKILRQELRQLKKLATKIDNINVISSKNGIKFSNERIIEINTAIHFIRDTIFEIKILINKS